MVSIGERSRDRRRRQVQVAAEQRADHDSERIEIDKQHQRIGRGVRRGKSRSARLAGFRQPGARQPVAPAAKSEPFVEALPAAPAVDVEARIAEAVSKAEAAVADQLSAIYEATLQAERDNHASERDQLSRSLGSEAVR